MLLLFITAIASGAFAQTGGNLFDQRRYVPPPTQAPEVRRGPPPSEPIPEGWIIAGVCTVAVLVLALLFVSVRAWRVSNLFDREYRFPVVRNPALRLGGRRCGGNMAAIDFKNRSD